ncbi:hypothetical protein BDN71DRAFT_1588826 [Pleurotus eryngii]|uniref:Ankyrin n=1 Tax=Pleurotus eryngii TaxID=5323 RepID=A0A9P6DHM9_PLEER|nr:hypothetical protein BDN71DRAFT_1588826 [Pleurotus eryngii]
MDHQHSFGLHAAALRGDANSFHKALEMGANINALDDLGRTVLMCAVAGESWQEVDASDASFVTLGRMKVIQTVIEHPDVSLYTLNAPQSAFNGVTPLGMASWLNSPQAVECLLEGSRETVSVNGMDSHAATPLMYAARDGNQEVTRILLSHGARPDFRDKNHRTSVQFSLSHPSTLWQCELALRQHRLRESRHPGRSRLLSASDHLLSFSEPFLSSCSQQSPPPVISTKDSLLQLTHSLVQCISASDASSVQALLFPLSPSLSTPPFVNYPDREGWSPIHRCAAAKRLSISVLDSLYCAGADVSLFTTKEHYTPLHCLALFAGLSEEDPDPSLTLYQFAIHLIRDLQAPLSARNKNDETCIHIAAEHGSCIDILMSFLECDTTGSIREFRNSRGLTALEVAKPEFRVAFGDDCDRLRSISSLSNRTVRELRPTASLTSIVSFSNERSSVRDNELLVADDDIALSSHKLIAHLRFTCPTSQHAPDASNVFALSEALAESQALGQVILQNYRGRADDAMKDLYEARNAVARIGAMLDKVSDSVDGELAQQGLQPSHVLGGRFRDSQDSQATAVASEDGEYVQVVSTTQSSPQTSGQCSPMSATGKPVDACSIAIQNACLDLIRSATKESQQRSPSFFRSLSGSSTVPSVRSSTLVDEEEAIIGSQVWDPSSIAADKSLCTEEKTANIFKRAWKHWFKKKDVETIKASRPPFRQQLTIDTKACQLTSRVTSESATDEDGHIHLRSKPLRVSHVVLDAARKDLHQIEEVLLAAEQFLTAANHSINRTALVIDRAIKKRHTAVDALHALSLAGHSPNYVHSNSSPYLTAPTPLSCLSSPNSSCVSLAATLTENDDDDVRAIRRLLLRKIEASLGGSIDEISKVTGWLPLVKEAVASVKRRTYL